MRRLTSYKRSKSPPPSSYSMDNPVFEDTTTTTTNVQATAHPVHVRYYCMQIENWQTLSLYQLHVVVSQCTAYKKIKKTVGGAKTKRHCLFLFTIIIIILLTKALECCKFVTQIEQGDTLVAASPLPSMVRVLGTCCDCLRKALFEFFHSQHETVIIIITIVPKDETLVKTTYFVSQMKNGFG